jgi:hypothetical protein
LETQKPLRNYAALAVPQPPGGVYLCQVGETVSCGACCGLYNLADASRGRLQVMLARRTERFRRTPRTPEAIDAFQAEMDPAEPQPRPFHDFYHCPFVGLVGEGGRRVGCLLHPLSEGNGGVDHRGLSFYGGLACREYFCPSCRSLPPAYKVLVQAACDDWYLYGLAITEERLLSAFFGEVERRLGRPLPADPGELRPEAAAAVAAFLRLKLEWPFRGPGWKGPAHYIFNDGLHPRPAVDYARLGASPSPHDAVLRELETCPRSAPELEEAERRIERLIARMVAGLRP